MTELANENTATTTATGERLYHKKAGTWCQVTKAYEDGTKDVQEEGDNGRFWAHCAADELDTKGPE